MKKRFHTTYALFFSALCMLSPKEACSALNYETYLESWDSHDGGWSAAMMGLPPGPGGTTGTSYAGVVLDISFANYDISMSPVVLGTSFSTPATDIPSITTYVHGKTGKVKMSFGGANSAYNISQSAGWPGNISALATGVANIVKNTNYHLDGIDLDVEDQLASVPGSPTATQFATNITQFIQALRTNLGSTYLISLTIPGQGWNTYWEILAKQVAAIPGLVNSINVMEYDIWIPSGSTYEAQIVADLQTYTGDPSTSPGPNGAPGWGIPASLIQLGLMPGTDDTGQVLSVAGATNLSKSAATTGAYTPGQVLFGAMTWDLNRDAQTTLTNPVTGVPPYSYSEAIRLGVTQPITRSANSIEHRGQLPKQGQVSERFIRQAVPPHGTPP